VAVFVPHSPVKHPETAFNDIFHELKLMSIHTYPELMRTRPHSSVIDMTGN
jgi:hypothetical protein